MAKVKGTEENDTLDGTEEGDNITARGGNDTISDLGGDDVIQPGPGDDTLAVGFGRDLIDIQPGGGHDRIMGFTSGDDTLLLKNFRTLDHFDDLRPFFTIDPDAVTVTLDVSAAAGGTPGEQTLTFQYTTDPIHRHDVEFDPEILEIDPSAVVTRFEPRLRVDPGRFDLTDPEDPEVPEIPEYLPVDGPFVQPFEDPYWLFNP
jgi:hypothetical protein